MFHTLYVLGGSSQPKKKIPTVMASHSSHSSVHKPSSLSSDPPGSIAPSKKLKLSSDSESHKVQLQPSTPPQPGQTSPVSAIPGSTDYRLHGSDKASVSSTSKTRDAAPSPTVAPTLLPSALSSSSVSSPTIGSATQASVQLSRPLPPPPPPPQVTSRNLSQTSRPPAARSHRKISSDLFRDQELQVANLFIPNQPQPPSTLWPSSDPPSASSTSFNYFYPIFHLIL